MTTDDTPKIDIEIEDAEATESGLTMLARIKIPRPEESRQSGRRTEPVARALARITLFDILGKFIEELEARAETANADGGE